MKITDCMKMLMEFNHISVNMIAKWRGTSVQNVYKTMRNEDMKCSVAIEYLDFLGYEIIVREKGRGLRRADEILIDDENFEYSVEQLKLMAEEKHRAVAKEVHYKEVDKDIAEKYPKGMNIRNLMDYFGKRPEWVHKYFDGSFFGKRVPLMEISRIIREYNL